VNNVPSVEAVFRYPVKSMLGTCVEQAEVRASGLAGDRSWALVDRQTGKVASAKQPRLWRSLLQLRAEYHGGAAWADPADAVTITLPDGTVLRAGEPGADEVLSGFVGRPVGLRQGRAAGTGIDRAVPEEVLAHGVGAEVAFESIFMPTVRCAVPTLAHGQDPGNPQVLRALARSNRIPIAGFGAATCAGVYAKVVSPGRVRAGDEVRVGSLTASNARAAMGH
jgi:uncharacterized protein YcbX